MLAAFCPCRPVTGCRALRARPAAAASFAAPNSRPGEPFMKRGGEASEAPLVDVGQRELGEHRARLDVASAMLAVPRGDSPVAASVSRVVAAPVAVAVATKIGPRKTRLRAQAGTAVVARSAPVSEPR